MKKFKKDDLVVCTVRYSGNEYSEVYGVLEVNDKHIVTVKDSGNWEIDFKKSQLRHARPKEIKVWRRLP